MEQAWPKSTLPFVASALRVRLPRPAVASSVLSSAITQRRHDDRNDHGDDEKRICSPAHGRGRYRLEGAPGTANDARSAGATLRLDDGPDRERKLMLRRVRLPTLLVALGGRSRRRRCSRRDRQRHRRRAGPAAEASRGRDPRRAWRRRNRPGRHRERRLDQQAAGRREPRQWRRGGPSSSPLLAGAQGRLWIAGSGDFRLELQSEEGDSEVYWDGTTLSLYEVSSAQRSTATRPPRPTEPESHGSGHPPSLSQIEEGLKQRRTLCRCLDRPANGRRGARRVHRPSHTA